MIQLVSTHMIANIMVLRSPQEHKNPELNPKMSHSIKSRITDQGEITSLTSVLLSQIKFISIFQNNRPNAKPLMTLSRSLFLVMTPSSAATLVSKQKRHTCPNIKIIELTEKTNRRKNTIISKTIVL